MEAMEKTVTAIVTSSSSDRIKREDCRRTRHDSAFSRWQVLTGPSDWEDHANGKDGAERYRTQNLPNCTSCTGVYELGIAVRRNKNGREASKLDPDFIIPIYIGKSDNVRNRLQQYGRDGAHLENPSSKTKLTDWNKILAQTGSGLFRDIFSKGFSIVYRWAPMKNTRDAEKTESNLLETFDYARNTGSNGPRRSNDILKKLDRVTKTSPVLAKLQLLSQKRKGIKIKAYEPPFLENGLKFYTNLETNGLLHQIFKFGRSQPRLVVRSGLNEDYTSMCGVALGHGVICKRSPVEGNKRCLEHKGMKVNGFTSKLLTDGNSTLVADEYPNKKDCTAGCGVILDDGSCCTSKPVHGNKRCLEHKGRKISNSTCQPVKDKKEHYVHGPILDFDISPSKAGKKRINTDCSSTICGVEVDDGTFCTRQPLGGRKRCEEHKGIRIKETVSNSCREEIPRAFEFEHPVSKSSREKSQNQSFIPSVFSESISPTCGAALYDGSFCSRKPSEGNKRCWQHKGMRVDASSGSRSCSNSRQTITSPHYASNSSIYDGTFCTRQPLGGRKRCEEHKGIRIKETVSNSCREEIPCVFEHPGSKSSREKNQNQSFIPSVFSETISPTCGAALYDGSFCSRKPSEGNKRCWQHKGMRVDASSGSRSCSNSRQTITSPHYASNSSIYEGFSSSCGAALQNGSFCSRKPTEGNKRCWQHEGMGADSNRGSSNNVKDCGNSYPYATYGSVYENVSSTCGAPTVSGSYCRRSTAGGRCWQHEGMGACSSSGSSNNSKYCATSYGYATYNFSSTCGAPTRSGSYCRRSTSGGRCWQH